MSSNHDLNKPEIRCNRSTTAGSSVKCPTKSNNDVNGGKFAQVFTKFQQKIDARNDKWERFVKLSRDVTIESKRIIFLLHRVTTLQMDSESDFTTTNLAHNKIFQEAEDRFEVLKQSKFFHLAQELRGEDPHQFSYPIKPGMQEFIEALSFYHFLKFDRLIDFKQVRKFLNFERKDSNDDQVLPPQMGKEMAFKIRVMKQNLEKVENACYVLRLRGSEVPKHMLVDVLQCFFKQHESDNNPDHTRNENIW